MLAPSNRPIVHSLLRDAADKSSSLIRAFLLLILMKRGHKQGDETTSILFLFLFLVSKVYILKVYNLAHFQI